MDLAAARPFVGVRRLFMLLWTLNAALARAARACVVALVTIMVGSIGWQVLTRALFNHSPPWTEEVALLAFGWVVLLMVALCAREHMHVRVDLLLKSLPGPTAAACDRAISVLITCIGAYLFWAGCSYVLEMRGATSQAIRYPSWLLYAAMPVASAMLTCFSIEHVVRGVPEPPLGPGT